MALQTKTAGPRRSSGSGQSELVFVALGGLGEIGKNCYLYGTGPETARQWLMVDLGITFPEGDFEPGVDVILPDLRFVEDEHINLVGIVLTHAHEDHIGALLELYPRLNVPIYATPFTAGLLRAKQVEFAGHVRPDMHIVKPGSAFKVGPFDLEFVQVAHSIPEPQGLVIKTAEGTVYHTGDWKVDATPYIGTDTDAARLNALGQGGIDALVCDSTNAMREGRSPSESDIAGKLTDVIATGKRAVAVTIFSSNVSRIKAIAAAAAANGRALVVAGRAMHRMIAVAIETGHLPSDFKHYDQSHYQMLDPAKALVLCTGSQGEPRAAIARIADQQHPDVKLGPGDMMIFSSRTIPGNEKAVGRIQNKLVDLGVELITDNEALVHVTGHPRRDELRDMYAWIKPKLAIPMHGEARHLAAHAELARKAGVPKVMVVRNGDIVRIAPGDAAVIDEAPVGRLFRDGRLLVGAEEAPLRERRKLSFVGVAFVSVVLNRKGELVADPDVVLDGIPETAADGTEMLELALDAADGAIRSIPPGRRKDAELVEEAIAKSVRSAIDQAWGKKPIVHCIVTKVDAKA